MICLKSYCAISPRRWQDWSASSASMGCLLTESDLSNVRLDDICHVRVTMSCGSGSLVVGLRGGQSCSLADDFGTRNISQLAYHHLCPCSCRNEGLLWGETSQTIVCRTRRGAIYVRICQPGRFLGLAPEFLLRSVLKHRLWPKQHMLLKSFELLLMNHFCMQCGHSSFPNNFWRNGVAAKGTQQETPIQPVIYDSYCKVQRTVSAVGNIFDGQERVVYRKLFLSMLRSSVNALEHLRLSSGVDDLPTKKCYSETETNSPGAEYMRLMDVGMLPRRASGFSASPFMKMIHVDTSLPCENRVWNAFPHAKQNHLT